MHSHPPLMRRASFITLTLFFCQLSTFAYSENTPSRNYLAPDGEQLLAEAATASLGLGRGLAEVRALVSHANLFNSPGAAEALIRTHLNHPAIGPVAAQLLSVRPRGDGLEGLTLVLSDGGEFSLSPAHTAGASDPFAHLAFMPPSLSGDGLELTPESLTRLVRVNEDMVPEPQAVLVDLDGTLLDALPFEERSLAMLFLWLQNREVIEDPADDRLASGRALSDSLLDISLVNRAQRLINEVGGVSAELIAFVGTLIERYALAGVVNGREQDLMFVLPIVYEAMMLEEVDRNPPPLFPGVRDFLSRMHASGTFLYMGTNGFQSVAQRIMQLHGLESRFQGIWGTIGLGAYVGNKGNMLLDIKRLHNIRLYRQVAIMGDSGSDMGASRAPRGRKFAAVGLAKGDVVSAESLVEGGADILVPNFEDWAGYWEGFGLPAVSGDGVSKGRKRRLTSRQRPPQIVHKGEPSDPGEAARARYARQAVKPGETGREGDNETVRPEAGTGAIITRGRAVRIVAWFIADVGSTWRRRLSPDQIEGGHAVSQYVSWIQQPGLDNSLLHKSGIGNLRPFPSVEEGLEVTVDRFAETVYQAAEATRQSSSLETALAFLKQRIAGEITSDREPIQPDSIGSSQPVKDFLDWRQIETLSRYLEWVFDTSSGGTDLGYTTIMALAQRIAGAGDGLEDAERISEMTAELNALESNWSEIRRTALLRDEETGWVDRSERELGEVLTEEVAEDAEGPGSEDLRSTGVLPKPIDGEVFDARIARFEAAVQGDGLVEIDEAQAVFGALGNRDSEIGHVGHVLGVDISPDGKSAVTGGTDNTVRVWSIKSGEHRVLQGHTGDVLSVTFSPNGEWIASSSKDKTARVWDAAAGRELQVFTHEDWVGQVVFDEESQRIATASEDRTARVWNAVTGEQLAVFKGHTSAVNGVVFGSASHGLAMSSGRDGKALVWNSRTGQAVGFKPLFMKFTGWLHGLSVSPDGQHVLTVGSDAARIWSVRKWGTELKSFGQMKIGSMNTAALNPEGSLLVTTHQDGTARIWDVESADQLVVIQGHNKTDVTGAVFSPDGKRVITTSRDSTVRMWDVSNVTSAGDGLAGVPPHIETAADVVAGITGEVETSARPVLGEVTDLPAAPFVFATANPAQLPASLAAQAFKVTLLEDERAVTGFAAGGRGLNLAPRDWRSVNGQVDLQSVSARVQELTGWSLALFLPYGEASSHTYAPEVMIPSLRMNIGLFVSETTLQHDLSPVEASLLRALLYAYQA